MTPERQLDGFIEKFTPEIAAQARTALAWMTARLPGATIPVYDNYNALAIGFGPSGRVRDIVFSLAVYPRWVSLFLARGRELADPHGLLAGEGGVMRHIRLVPATLIEDPRVEALISAALARADPPIDPAAAGGIVIKSISATQRPRRP